MKELPVRIVVAVVGIPLLVYCVMSGGVWFFLLALVISVLGQWEMFNILRAREVSVQRLPAWLSGGLILYMVYAGFNNLLMALALLLLLYIFAAEMFRNKGSANLNTSGTLISIVYPGLFLATLVYLRGHFGAVLPVQKYDAAGTYLLVTFVSVWGCDTFAYFAGVNFGKHKLFERVSPKKSIEGGVAGLLGALLVFFLAEWVGLLHISLTLKITSGLIVGLVGQLGDLVESWFKRDAGIKDSSKILPGHGGILDRFDSLMFISPALLALYFIYQIN